MNGGGRPVHSPRMSDLLVTTAVAIVAAAVAAAATIAVFHRRVHRERARADEIQRSLDESVRTGEDDREVRGVILGSMEDGILLFDREGRTVFANLSLERHLGTTPGGIDELRPEPLRGAARRAGYAGTALDVEVEMAAPARWLRASAQPAGDDGSVLLVVRDVTDARRLDAVRRDFVANASHELKTPVASIRATAETLRHGAIDDPAAAHRFTDQLERDALRLSRIVSDLLDLSRLESGSELAERVRLDVVAADEIERLDDRAHHGHVTLELRADGVPSVVGSPHDLSLMVRNLIDNALAYTPAGGRIDVTVTTDHDDVVVRVSDTGIGIPQRDLPRVFERFYRVDRARSRETGGTGLGLAIVKHVAENHGGEVTVTSELAAGSTFEVRLPVAGAQRALAP